MARVDGAVLAEHVRLGVAVGDLDPVRWRARARVRKWDDDQVEWVRSRTGVLDPQGDLLGAHIDPYETVEADGNLLTTAGLGRVTSLIIAGGGQGLTATATRLGVGDSSTAANVADTDLGAASGSTHRYFQVMDATYPSQSGGVITAQATYNSSTANFAWAEWGLDIGTPTVAGGTTVAAVLLNHKITALGTKATGTWTLQVTITFS